MKNDSSTQLFNSFAKKAVKDREIQKEEIRKIEEGEVFYTEVSLNQQDFYDELVYETAPIPLPVMSRKDLKSLEVDLPEMISRWLKKRKK